MKMRTMKHRRTLEQFEKDIAETPSASATAQTASGEASAEMTEGAAATPEITYKASEILAALLTKAEKKDRDKANKKDVYNVLEAALFVTKVPAEMHEATLAELKSLLNPNTEYTGVEIWEAMETAYATAQESAIAEKEAEALAADIADAMAEEPQETSGEASGVMTAEAATKEEGEPDPETTEDDDFVTIQAGEEEEAEKEPDALAATGDTIDEPALDPTLVNATLPPSTTETNTSDAVVEATAPWPLTGLEPDLYHSG